jgi:NSS family neurotransmitter:Na+ symporter
MSADHSVASACPSTGAARETWSGRAGFILANIAAAVGLGSIWKFPYEVGANGGGAFLLFYLFGLALIVFPLMLTEFAIGRRGGADAVRSLGILAAAFRASQNWRLIGVIGVATGFLILSFYSVIGGWAIAYVIDTVRYGLDTGLVRQRFDSLLGAPDRMAFHHAVFMIITVGLVARGIAGGVELASRALMPPMILLMIALAGYSIVEGDLIAALKFLFALEFSRVSLRVALEALGLGFFSIGVGLSVMITYAAYLPRDIRLAPAAGVIIVSDTLISFLAGIAIFPIVFAEKLDPSSGPGLLFVTLPLAFAHIPFGNVAAVAFFLLLVLAAVGSAISMLELVVAFVQRAFGLSRPLAACCCGVACWLVGLATVLSFNRWAQWFPLAVIPNFATATIYDLLDHVTSNLLLPAAGCALALFAGWVLPASILAEQLGLGKPHLVAVRVLLRYVIPVVLAVLPVLPLFLAR